MNLGIMAPSQRRCIKCDAFLPSLASDPHPSCPRCRGGKCSLDGNKCDFCRTWTENSWKSLKPVPRPYASRNPMNRSKRPGKPSKQSLANSCPTQVKSNPSAPQAEGPPNIQTKPSHTVPQTGALSPQVSAVTSASDAFVGFHSKISPSKPRLEVFNAPMLVCDYKSLPNDKFTIVTQMLNKVHVEKRRFVKVVYNRESQSFDVVPASKPVSSLSYEEFMRGSGIQNNISLPQASPALVGTQASTSSISDSSDVQRSKPFKRRNSGVKACDNNHVGSKKNASPGQQNSVKRLKPEPVPQPVSAPKSNHSTPKPKLKTQKSVNPCLTLASVPQPDKKKKKSKSTPSDATCKDLFMERKKGGESLPDNSNNKTDTNACLTENRTNQNSTCLGSNLVNNNFNSVVNLTEVRTSSNVFNEGITQVKSSIESGNSVSTLSKSVNDSNQSLTGPIRISLDQDRTQLDHIRTQSDPDPSDRSPILGKQTANSDICWSSFQETSEIQKTSENDPNIVLENDFIPVVSMFDVSHAETNQYQEFELAENNKDYDNCIVLDNSISDSVVNTNDITYSGVDVSLTNVTFIPNESVTNEEMTNNGKQVIPNSSKTDSIPRIPLEYADTVGIYPNFSSSAEFIEEASITVNTRKGPVMSTLPIVYSSSNSVQVCNIVSNDVPNNVNLFSEYEGHSSENISENISVFNMDLGKNNNSSSNREQVSEQDSDSIDNRSQQSMLELQEQVNRLEDNYRKLVDNSIPSMSSSISAKLEDILASLKNHNNHISPENSPIRDDQDYDQEEQDPNYEVPNSPVESFENFSQLLSKPNDAMWNGVVGKEFFYFIDDMGFGWRVNFQTDEFFLTGEIYDISNLIATPRTPKMNHVLARVRFQGPSTPLFLLEEPNHGLINIMRSPTSKVTLKVLNPWELPVFENFKTRDEDSLGQEYPTEEESVIHSKKNVPKTLIATMDTARRRALEANDPERASIFQSLLEAIDPADSPEGSERNWPLVMKTLKEKFPETLRLVSTWNPGTMEKSDKPDIVFEDSDFFKQGLGWLNLLVKGQVSPSGKECSSDSPLQVGKWLPNSVAKMRRFYKHGTKEHISILPSAGDKSLLKPEVMENYDTSSTFTPASFFKSEADNISLLREILSTMFNLNLILKSDANFGMLSTASKAAIVSSSLALKDAMAVSCQLQANLMLLHRDKFLIKMQPKFLNARTTVPDEIRTASFTGPLIPESLKSSFGELTNNQQISFKSRPNFFRGNKRFKPNFSYSQRRAQRFRSSSTRGFQAPSRQTQFGNNKRGYSRAGRQRPRRGGGRNNFSRK